MPRRPRHFRPDSVFHIGDRGVDRQPIFLSDGDRSFFLKAMEEALAECDARTIAYCLMPNHFHWALATGEMRFGPLVQRVLTRHAVRFNRLHGRTGHLFEGRHWSKLCENLDQIENTIAYIHLNPVRAGLVRRPGDWQWSSARTWLADEDQRLIDISRLSDLTGRSIASLKQRHAEDIRAELAGGRRGLSPRQLVSEVASPLGLEVSALRSAARGEIYTKAKQLLVERAERGGISLVALAHELGCNPTTLYVLKGRRP